MKKESCWRNPFYCIIYFLVELFIWPIWITVVGIIIGTNAVWKEWYFNCQKHEDFEKDRKKANKEIEKYAGQLCGFPKKLDNTCIECGQEIKK